MKSKKVRAAHCGHRIHGFRWRYPLTMVAISRTPHVSLSLFRHEVIQHRTQTQTNLPILHKAHNGPTLNTLEQFRIYKHHKTHRKEILNDQTTYNDYALYDIIT